MYHENCLTGWVAALVVSELSVRNVGMLFAVFDII